jgi:hypothetical protein
MSAGPLQPGPWLDDGVVVADTGNVISSLPLHGRDPPGGSHGKLPRPTKVLSPLSSQRSYCDWRGRSSGRRREAVPAVSGATCFWICTCERTPSFRQKEKHYAVTGQPRVMNDTRPSSWRAWLLGCEGAVSRPLCISVCRRRVCGSGLRPCEFRRKRRGAAPRGRSDVAETWLSRRDQLCADGSFCGCGSDRHFGVRLSIPSLLSISKPRRRATWLNADLVERFQNSNHMGPSEYPHFAVTSPKTATDKNHGIDRLVSSP